MRKQVLIVLLTVFVMILKYVVSGAYFDYYLRKLDLNETQLSFIDENKRAIAELEYYKSPHYLFSVKDRLNMQEITPERTILLSSQELPHYPKSGGRQKR